TGISSVEVLGQAKFINEYFWNVTFNPLIRKKHYRYTGQKQTTVFFKFLGTDDEIQLDQQELVDYKWLTFDEVENIIAPERFAHANKVLAELAQIQ
ncbi:MAG TPA: hypothetical protein VHQ20_02355, partial [Patescibacteria group bacterium]|nr:hypothetical protein [Patescibacteria group bacterium]